MITMTNQSKLLMLVITMILSILVIWPMTALAMKASIIVGDNEPRKGYISWSLFLVCGNEMLLKEKNEALINLYNQFQAFGKAIGPEHDAVWFSKKKWVGDENFATSINTDRAAKYCANYKLKPSEGPFIVVSSSYPDIENSLEKPIVIALNDSSSAEITTILGKLTDQIIAEKLDQVALDSETYWLKWKRLIINTKDTASSLFKKVKVTIDTKIVKVEVDGSK